MLKLSAIELQRGGRPLLRGISLDLAPGELRLLLGANGSGKTTLLRLIAGLEAPDAGEIRIAGRLASTGGRLLLPPHQRELAMVFQEGGLWPHLSVEEHLRFGLKRRLPSRRAREVKISALLDAVGLRDRRRARPSKLSGGERQRLGIARALVQEPRILLLDEPLAHADPDAQGTLASLLIALIRDRSATALWVTHRLDDLLWVGARASILADGQIGPDLSAEEVADRVKRLAPAPGSAA